MRISAKQLERELGVTYKTAWRMFNKIRNDLMVQDAEPLSGEVEADETFVGGKPREGHYRIMREQGIEPRSPQSRAWHAARKQTVFGVVQRKGQVRAVVVPSSRAHVLRAKVGEYVLPSSIIYTDDYKGYDDLAFQRRYVHHRIPHHAKIYVDGNVHLSPSRGSARSSKTGSGASTTPSPRSGYGATSTSTRGGTTTATTRRRSSRRCCKG
jgi:transposase